ncbi:MAG TPA: 50S ribosomal protein L11 methyltransferase [Alphaproteobacteria bacterium]|nr:50S ribosomal protein L11 methyltransferase [Alphaproteobacteria bacterium]
MTPSTWVIAFEVPKAAGAVFADAVGELAASHSCFETADRCGWRFEALVGAEPERAAISVKLALVAAAVGVAPPVVEITHLPRRDWLAENRKQFPPTAIGRFFVHGSYFDGCAPAGSVAIALDAGLAFGSGTHESTRGCLMALDRLARRRRFARPFDLGTGSGILAIAMAKLWRAPVVAADIDPVAVAVARANAARNAVPNLVHGIRSDGVRAPVLRRRRPYDLIVANILARPLERLAPQVAPLLVRPGRLILSGLLTEQIPGVVAAFRAQGLALERRYRLGEWATLVLRKR